MSTSLRRWVIRPDADGARWGFSPLIRTGVTHRGAAIYTGQPCAFFIKLHNTLTGYQISARAALVFWRAHKLMTSYFLRCIDICIFEHIAETSFCLALHHGTEFGSVQAWSRQSIKWTQPEEIRVALTQNEQIIVEFYDLKKKKKKANLSQSMWNKQPLALTLRSAGYVLFLNSSSPRPLSKRDLPFSQSAYLYVWN